MSVGRPMCGESTARTIVAVRLVSRGLPWPWSNGGSEVVVSTRTQPAAAHRRDSLRALRILWRSPLVLLHVLVALPLMGLVVNSLGARITVGGLRWDHRAKLGRASCRERVCQYVSISVVGGKFKKK